jgi:hypothetical protein
VHGINGSYRLQGRLRPEVSLVSSVCVELGGMPVDLWLNVNCTVLEEGVKGHLTHALSQPHSRSLSANVSHRCLPEEVHSRQHEASPPTSAWKINVLGGSIDLRKAGYQT